LEDKRRGLFSYEALASRLANNQYAVGNLKDFSGPVIKLANLTTEDLLVLAHRIRSVFDSAQAGRQMISDESITKFLNHCASTLGSDFFLTPRGVVKGFVGLLSIIEQNPQANIDELIGATNVSTEAKSLESLSDTEPADAKDGMTSISI
jgi:hypothetical protein